MLIIFRMKNTKIGEFFSVNLCPNDAKRGLSSFISTVFDPEIVDFLIIGASHKKRGHRQNQKIYPEGLEPST